MSADSEPSPIQVAGLLLAAGSGSRFGGPKALVRGPDGETWLARAVRVLAEGGCAPVHVVIGAAPTEVRREVPPTALVVVADGWAEGMGASLRAGLAALTDAGASPGAVLVMLVDTPGVTSGVVRRLVDKGAGPQTLVRAAYDGAPSHPVLIGRDHWAGVAESARGDRGARDYLSSHDVTLVEVGDLGSGADIDTSAALDAWRAGSRTLPGRLPGTDSGSPPS